MSNELIKQAKNYYQQGDFDNALRCYHQLLQDNPNDAELLHITAILHAKTHDYQKAIELLDKAIAIAPKNIAYHNSKANVLLRLEKLDEAINEYKICIKLDSQYAIAYNNLGRIYYLREKYQDAEKQYKKAIKIEPTYADAHYNYALLLIQKNRYADAIQALEKI